MASLVLSGDTSGSVTLAAPAVAGSTTQTLVNVTGTLAPVVSGTAITLTNQTAPEFTGIPSWVKRITLMLNGVSTNSTGNILIQIGSGSYTTSGYASSVSAANSGTTSTSGFIITFSIAAAHLRYGTVVLNLLTGNTWVSSGSVGESTNAVVTSTSTGGVALSGALDRLRLYVDGTQQFDAGTINILYE